MVSVKNPKQQFFRFTDDFIGQMNIRMQKSSINFCIWPEFVNVQILCNFLALMRGSLNRDITYVWERATKTSNYVRLCLNNEMVNEKNTVLMISAPATPNSSPILVIFKYRTTHACMQDEKKQNTDSTQYWKSTGFLKLIFTHLEKSPT